MEREVFYNPMSEKFGKHTPVLSGIQARKEAQEAIDQALIDQLEGQIEGMEDELPFVLAKPVEEEPELNLEENDRKRQADLERALSGFIN